jgi:AcrR family transcriptional regulator
VSGEHVSLREQQAETARALIRSAALAAFIEDGFMATTMTDIAGRAGVARQTVYNLFESKASLLIAAIADRVEGAEQRSQSTDHQAVRDAGSPEEMIDLFARSSAGVAERALPVLRIAYEAAAVDGEVAKHLERNEEQRHLAQSFFIDVLEEKGFLRTDIPIEELKQGFWLLASPLNLITAIDGGWTITTYITWLTQTAKGLLLASPGAPS